MCLLSLPASPLPPARPCCISPERGRADPPSRDRGTEDCLYTSSSTTSLPNRGHENIFLPLFPKDLAREREGAQVETIEEIERGRARHLCVEGSNQGLQPGRETREGVHQTVSLGTRHITLKLPSPRKHTPFDEYQLKKKKTTTTPSPYINFHQGKLD